MTRMLYSLVIVGEILQVCGNDTLIVRRGEVPLLVDGVHDVLQTINTIEMPRVSSLYITLKVITE